VLHDDVLPQLHAALLHLNSPMDRARPPGCWQTPTANWPGCCASCRPGGSLRLGGLGLIDALRRLASGEFARAFDAIDWAVDPAPKTLPCGCRR
jgi:hypothetical protein